MHMYRSINDFWNILDVTKRVHMSYLRLLYLLLAIYFSLISNVAVRPISSFMNKSYRFG